MILKVFMPTQRYLSMVATSCQERHAAKLHNIPVTSVLSDSEDAKSVFRTLQIKLGYTFANMFIIMMMRRSRHGGRIAICQSGRMSSIPARWMTGQKIDGVAGAEYRGRLRQMRQTDPEVKAERSFQSLQPEGCQREYLQGLFQQSGMYGRPTVYLGTIWSVVWIQPFPALAVVVQVFDVGPSRFNSHPRTTFLIFLLRVMMVGQGQVKRREGRLGLALGYVQSLDTNFMTQRVGFGRRFELLKNFFISIVRVGYLICEGWHLAPQSQPFFQ